MGASLRSSFWRVLVFITPEPFGRIESIDKLFVLPCIKSEPRLENSQAAATSQFPANGGSSGRYNFDCDYSLAFHSNPQELISQIMETFGIREQTLKCEANMFKDH